MFTGTRIAYLLYLLLPTPYQPLPIPTYSHDTPHPQSPPERCPQKTAPPNIRGDHTRNRQKEHGTC